MVEFLEPEPDEKLPEPAPVPRHRALLTRAATVVVVLAAVAVWALTRTDPVRRPAPASPRPTTASTPAPEVIACHAGRPSPDLTAPMARYLNGLAVTSLAGFRCVRAGKTVFESISGHYHSVDIELQAVVRGIGAENLSLHAGNERSRMMVVARLEALTAGLHVIVLAYGRHGAVPPIPAMRRLVDYVSLNVVL